MRRVIAVVAMTMGLLSGVVSAATIEGSFSGNATATNTYDMATIGAVDWVYWDETISPVPDGEATNEKSGADLIGNAFGVGTDTQVRGPSNKDDPPTMSFSFNDGVSPASGIVSNAAGVFNVTHNVASNGVGVVIDLPTTDTYQITVYVSGYGSVLGLFTASINGAADYVSTEFQDGPGGGKDSAFYILYVTPDAAGDDLTIEFVQETDGAGYDFATLNGVAVCMAPPVSLAGSFSGNASATGEYNLSSLGREDWVFWHTGSTGGTPSNSKSDGDLISDAFIVGTGSTLSRPSTSIGTTLDFTYSDGTDPVSGTVSEPSGVFNNTANVVGNGVGLTINLPTVDTYIISVFVAGFYSDGRFTADLPGAPQYVNTEFKDAAGGYKDCSIFTLTATPRNAGDDLTVKFSQITETGYYEFLMFTGVAVRLAPPAGTVILVN